MPFYNIKFYFKARFPRFLYYKTKLPERDRKTLKKRFDELDIPRNRYCFGKCKANDMMAMRRILFFWMCYYCERGKSYDRRIFINAAQACHYMFCAVVMNFMDDNKNAKLPLSEEERAEINSFCYAGLKKGGNNADDSDDCRYYITSTYKEPKGLDLSYETMLNAVSAKLSEKDISISDFSYLVYDEYSIIRLTCKDSGGLEGLRFTRYGDMATENKDNKNETFRFINDCFKTEFEKELNVTPPDATEIVLWKEM